jgi:DNA-binding HxlR family transcriptional regulator
MPILAYIMEEMTKIPYPNTESVCACKVSLDLLGDRWTLIIIRDLFRRKNTFSQFLNNDEHISSNVLVDRLKKLRSMEIIGFLKNEKDKKIKEYFLTDRGVDLYPIIFELQLWSTNHVNFNASDNTKKWVSSVKTNAKHDIIKKYQENYKKLRFDTFGF